MTRLFGGLERAAIVAGAAALALMASAVNVFVALRYLFDVSPFWSEESVRICLLVAVFLGAAASVRSHGHIRVEFLANLLPPTLRRVWYGVLDLAMLGLFVLLVFTGIEAVQFNRTTNSISMQIPLAWIMWLVPAGFALAAAFQLETMLRQWRNGR